MRTKANCYEITQLSDQTHSGCIAYYKIKNLLAGEGTIDISATINGFEAQQARAQIKCGETLNVGIHTHLFEKTKYKLKLDFDTNGKKIGSETIVITKPEETELFAKVGQALRQSNTPIIFFGPCDSVYYPYDTLPLKPWFDQPNAEEHIAGLLRNNTATEIEAEQLRRFVNEGFLVLEDFLNDDTLAKINAEIDDAIEKKYKGYEYGSSERVEHLHDHYPTIRDVWLGFTNSKILNLIFGHDGSPCQTLTFIFGSQQDPHQDTIHLTPYPAGYMCGIWIALQNVVPESGELVIYPKSHKEDRLYMDRIGCEKVEDDWNEFGETVVPIWGEMANRYDREIYRPKKGTMAVWHENLLHGGSKRIDETQERRSLVIHAFAKGSVVYYDSTGQVGTINV